VDVIQEVGAYAGFAAVVGLAVLAALFFSQARDLRRLREWAGRAPERAAEQAASQDAALTPQPARPAPTGAVRPIPAARPAPAAPAQTGAKPATAAAQPATAAKPATAVGKPATAAATAGAAATQVKPGETKPGEAKPDDKKPGEEKAGDKPGTEVPAPAAAAPTGPAPATAAAAPAAPRPAGPPVPPARPPAIPPRPAPVGRTPAPATASQSTAVLPASARVRGLERSDRRRGGLDARYIALIVAVLVLGAGAAFGISQLGGDDDAPSTDERAAQDSQPAGPLNRSLVTVSVLNGTTVPGLAAQIGDEIESKGFQRGNVANAIDQQRPDSVVMFAEGAERPARVVARGLGISTVEPVDPDSQALAGNASVVVVVGMDQTQ
jgi:hypothetical protein